jgi:peptidyl-prolyl cis-trans isomerase-like protein 2
VFNENTHIVAIKTSGNVYAFEAVERLNIKAKFWKDLMTDESFSRKDIITIQVCSLIEMSGRIVAYHECSS